MAAFGAVAAAAETPDRTTEPRSSTHSRGHSLGTTHRCPLAGSAGTLWPGRHGGEPVLPLAQSGDLGPPPGSIAGPRRGPRGHRLGSALRRCHRGARSPARRRRPPGRRKKGFSAQENAAAEALGRSQGGFSTKIHLRAEGHGRPIAVTLTGGERHEQTALVEILDAGAVRRTGPGRPRLRPRRLAGDKAYAGRPVRTHLRRRGIQPVIPSKKGQPRNPFFDRQAYRLRNRVERLINRLKQFRRIATRYEKRAVNYLAMIVIGAILLWL